MTIGNIFRIFEKQTSNKKIRVTWLFSDFTSKNDFTSSHLFILSLLELSNALLPSPLSPPSPGHIISFMIFPLGEKFVLRRANKSLIKNQSTNQYKKSCRTIFERWRRAVYHMIPLSKTWRLFEWDRFYSDGTDFII